MIAASFDVLASIAVAVVVLAVAWVVFSIVFRWWSRTVESVWKNADLGRPRRRRDDD